MDNNVKLVDSKEGKVLNEQVGSRREIKWSRIGGTLVVCGGIFTIVTSMIKESIDYKKLELSSEYLSYVEQIEDTFDTDLPDYMEEYINKYGLILEKMDSYSDLTLKEQYNLRYELLDDVVFVEDSSLIFLKDICVLNYGGNIADAVVSFHDGSFLNLRPIISTSSSEHILYGDMAKVANSLYDLQGWKDDNTGEYRDDWKNEKEFGEFVDDIKSVIFDTAYMVKNFVDDDYQNSDSKSK
ncbi:MAG: hypothetical protein J6B89_02575 [Bacilli bacterium]|nr:hypothetical protein [Bacilli bacterium]